MGRCSRTILNSSLLACALAAGALAAVAAAAAGQVAALPEEAQAVSSTTPAPASTQAPTRMEMLREQRARKLAAEAELSVLPDVEHALEDTLARDVRALYRLKRGGLLPVASGLEALMSHASRVAHLERMARRTLGELEKTQAGRSRLSKELAASEASIAALEREVAAAEAAEAARVTALASMLPSELGPELGPERNPERAAPADRVGYGLSVIESAPAPRPGRFAGQRGMLALPVSSASSIEPSDEDGGMALRFVTRRGASVRAAAAGRVLRVEREPEAGFSVLIDHGQGYRTRYGELGAVEVQVGDAVSKSARLGVARESAVRFDVQLGEASEDARAWLGL